MKKDKLQKLRDKSKEDLQKELKAAKDNLWQLRADLAGGKVKNVKEIHGLKKTIAVVNTLLNEK